MRKFYHWLREMSKDWTGLTRHARANIVLFSQGVARANHSQLRRVAGCVGGRAESQRRRLQRFVRDGIDVWQFFAVWTASLVRALRLKELVLAVDETKIGNQFGVLVVGLVLAKRAIPLAWRVYRANDAAAYPPEGQTAVILALLSAVKGGLPKALPVRVLADRGIGTSATLMRGVMALEWTFLFRVTKQSKVVLPDGQAITFHDQVRQPLDCYAISGLVFKKRGRLPAHVRVVWGERAKAPWALVTNDPDLSGWEYAERMWLEEAFRDLKSHGWQLEATCLTCPDRMARLWVLLVAAYAWLLVWGMTLAAGGKTIPQKCHADGSKRRQWSLFREGRQAFLHATSPPLVV